MRMMNVSNSVIASLAAVAASVAAPLAAQDDPAKRWLSPDQVASDMALAEEAYSRIHPGYTRYASVEEMRNAWASIVMQAETDGGMAVGDLYLAVQLALTNIRCDHTKAELPRALRDARIGQPLYLPFRWELIEGRGIIANPGQGTGLVRGDEILAIDGRELSLIAERIAGFIPVDGNTLWARTGQIAQSREFMGGGVDHFGMLLWGAPAQAELTIRSANGEERAVTVDRIAFADWSAMGEMSRVNFTDAVRFERLGKDTGYLSVDTFVNYRRPIDPHTVLAPVFEAMADEGRNRLILDLRKNGGGSTDAAHALASYLIPEAMQLKRDMRVATLDLDGLRENLTTWDQRALNPDPRGFIANPDGTYTLRDGIADDTAIVMPADAAFGGELIILTSTANSSGSTNMIAILAQQERTTLIGEPTGGSAEGPTAGILFTLTLPESGIRTRIPLFRYRNNVSAFEEGLGIVPDIVAPITVSDFRSGTDRALDLAKALPKPQPASAAAAAQEPTLSADDLAPMVGEGWAGELDYLNYNSDTRSAIPVRMFVEEPSGRSVRYGFLYPGEEHKNATERMRISRDGRMLNGYRITQRYRNDVGNLVIVTQGTGRDDYRDADIRLTYEIGQRVFINRKDVRFEGGEFFNRNEYRLTRE
ncbi:MAG: S41 family peptidase [Pseudomonadota bacterium]